MPNTLGVPLRFAKNLIKALVGFVLLFVVHVPRLFYYALLWSFAWVFNNHPTLTANPKEHLKRARKILDSGRLDQLLYAALEIRFALERMTHNELIFADLASNRMLDESSPVKKVANMHRLAPGSAFPHDVYFINRNTGERFRWGAYKPLDKARVSQIHGRLGDLLHPKEGISLGVWTDDWYTETSRFLSEALDYLTPLATENESFFANEGLEQFELVPLEDA